MAVPRELDEAVAFSQMWLEVIEETRDIPGFVVAVAHRGTVLMNRAYGWANLELGEPMTPDHVFRIASHSKTFTATVVMMLAALRWVPWLPQNVDPRWQTVTVRQLLSHGAGVVRDGLDSNFWVLGEPFPDAPRFRQALLETGLMVEPNTRLKYSNFGYTVLGMVIEAVTGQSYHDAVTERIIQPLKLDSTFPEYFPELDARLARGYGRRERLQEPRLALPHIDTAAMAPATGFCSTSADLCTYFTAHAVGSGKLLSDESKKEMQRRQWNAKLPGQETKRGYGLGFIVDEMGSRPVLGHSGGFPGFITQTMMDPGDGLVVSVLTNAIDGPAADILQGIFHIVQYFAEHGAADDSLRQFAGRYINLFNRRAFVAAGAHLVSVDPAAWKPFACGVDVLEPDGEGAFRIVDTGSFGSEGEEVRFTVQDGAVSQVSYAGSTLFSAQAWSKKRVDWGGSAQFPDHSDRGAPD
jgi:D-alanyl-D-alanine carboxypeptidase